MTGAIHWLVRWNAIVVLVALALGCAGFALVGAAPDPVVLALLGAGAFVVYGLDRRAGFSPEDLDPDRLIPPVPLGVLAGVSVIMAALLTRVDRAVAAGITGLGGIALLYILPLLPGRRRLKDIPLLKTPLVAGGWAVGTILLPALGAGHRLDAGVWSLLGYRMVFLTPNLMLADWPDRTADRAADIHTFANRLPPKRFVALCRATCIAAVAANLCLWWRHALPAWALTESATPVAFLAILARPLPDGRGFYTTVADAILAWPGVVSIVTMISHF